MVIYLHNQQYFFHYELCVGVGTKTVAELTALWRILKLARFKNLSIFHIYGDSTVMIDWFNIISNLQSFILEL